ncbi:uncharacterized protein A4U43_UnF7810 [Asparagus officinalis]|uniref:Leucine-rich repeat-containing N-terminal plant-type domain-containing protein n=1 Tax=Asparagus officinalis TaxID=4686 RepID=A0A1R3L644_ASPOF|nr:polygalacturonase inhibitor-like [Asparagus officinalis]ONK55089.1 uncharacterized protein A4U43_UnF7810 [Asparagus officinalis]
MARCILALTALMLFSFRTSSSACNVQDRRALVAFRDSFPPNSLPSWTSTPDCCFWQGVRCSKRTGRVRLLSIFKNKNLTGAIPPSIGSLPYLESIALSRLPNLVGPIPPQISNLRKLQFLTIYETKVSGPIPNIFSKMPQLKEINLLNNNITGSIPASIGDIPNLFTLDLSGNRLTGTIPASLFSRAVSSITPDLDLSNNMLTGDLPLSFNKVRFTNFDLSNNNLTGSSAWVLFGSSKPVTQIILSSNEMVFNMSKIEDFPVNLTYLDISHNKIFGAISDKITQLTNFGYLDVSNNNLCGKIPSGGKFRDFGPQAYQNNTCLCGTPLPPCK